jgi:molecular chaperone DnaJ
MASQDWFDKDFYKVLGVDKNVSDADLKKTYRKLARKYHPDSNQGDAKAEATFKEVSEAYSVLSDPEQRKEYDQIRAMGSGARFTAGGQPGGFEDVFSMFGQGRGGRQSPQDFDDIFSMFNQQQGGGFGSGRFGQSTGGFRGYGGPQRGADVTARTTIDFLTATKGETITLQGEDGKPFKVKIPAGVSDGQKIRLRGRGRPSPDGGEAGDIVVQVTVRPHPAFTREGDDRGAHARRRARQAARGAGHAVRTRAAREGPRGALVQRHRRPARRSAGRRSVAPRRRGPRGAGAVPRAGAEGQSPRGSDGTLPRVARRARRMPDRQIDEDAPIFAIAVAAELAGMHPQTLRQYDRLGLVVPARTQGGSRRYSTRHVEQLREVARMSSDGMSLPAIARIIELENHVQELRVRVRDLESRMRAELESRPGARVFAAGATGSVVTLRQGRRVRRATDIVVWRPRLAIEEEPQEPRGPATADKPVPDKPAPDKPAPDKPAADPRS